MLKLGGYFNFFIALGHLVGLFWAKEMFEITGIGGEMEKLSQMNVILPYLLTVFVAVVFFIFGLYGLSASGKFKPLPLLKPAVFSISGIYLFRGLGELIADTMQGILAMANAMYSIVAIIIGLLYLLGGFNKWKMFFSHKQANQKNNLNFFFFCFFFFSFSFSFSQPTTDEQLAVHYFQNGEFDKAILYYEKLYDKNPLEIYYGNYLKCLLNTENYKEAEKIVKHQIKKYPDVVNYQVDLGYVYSKSENPSKAKQQYEKIINGMVPNPSQIISVSNAFIAVGEPKFALSSLQRGRKLLHDGYPFNFEIAEIYSTLGNFEMMIDEYLSMLDLNESYLQEVQNALQRNMVFETGSAQNQILKTQLLKRVQQNVHSNVFAEMLIWLYIQQRDFENAFIQVKAVDKRGMEEGGRLITLAQLCTSNQNYDIAVKCYQYVIEKGKNGSFYSNAKMELLNTLNQKITTTGNYKQTDLFDLEKLYSTTIEELGKSAATIPLIKDFAYLEGTYLRKPEEAIRLLEEAISLPRARSQMQAECKIALGDVLVITGEIWDASLLYSQVEKDYKYDQLGEQAKFKNSKISYFTGDFKWARAQLDVLKGSTSKLIANDAMHLSLLITDNTGIDTTTNPLIMFARAELLSIQHQDSISMLILDSINLLYPGHALADDILFQKYRIFLKQQNFLEAANSLQKILDNYSTDILGDDALFLLAQLNHFNLNDLEKAKALYEKILVDFPGSIYTVEARKRFRYLRGDAVSKDEIFLNNIH